MISVGRNRASDRSRNAGNVPSSIALRAAPHNDTRKRDVVQAQQAQPEQLALHARDAGCRRARSACRRGSRTRRRAARVAREARVVQVQAALPGERRAGARRAASAARSRTCRCPARDHAQDALRVADAHEVARARRPAAGLRHASVVANVSSRSSPTDRPPIAKPSNGSPVIWSAERRRRCQVDPALHDAEAQLARRGRRGGRALGPARRCARRRARRPDARPRPAGTRRTPSRCRSRARPGSPSRSRASCARACRRRPSGT